MPPPKSEQSLTRQLFKHCRAGTPDQLRKAVFLLSEAQSRSPSDVLNLARTATDETPLHLICTHHTDPIPSASLLLSLGALASPRGHGTHRKTPLHEAARRGLPELCRLLLCTGAAPNEVKSGDWTPLMLAASSASAETVSTLLATGARPALRNRTGETALHLATRAQCPEAISSLLATAPEGVSWRTRNGRSVVHYAARSGSVACVRVFVERGGEVDALENGGMTALHEAAAGGRVDVVKWLMGRREGFACVWLGDGGGLSPLHHAVITADVGTVRAVIDAVEKMDGAAAAARLCGLKDARGFTPVFLAVCKADKEVLVELVDRGGVVQRQWVGELQRLGRAGAVAVLEAVLRANEGRGCTSDESDA